MNFNLEAKDHLKACFGVDTICCTDVVHSILTTQKLVIKSRHQDLQEHHGKIYAGNIKRHLETGWRTKNKYVNVAGEAVHPLNGQGLLDNHSLVKLYNHKFKVTIGQ